jgi:hypothetical protein
MSGGDGFFSQKKLSYNNKYYISFCSFLVEIITIINRITGKFLSIDTQKISIFFKIKSTCRYGKICVINAKYCMNTAINSFRREVNKFVIIQSSTFVRDNDNSKKSAGRSI